MGEVRFLPAQPMVKVGGCNFCQDRYPGAAVHVITPVGVEGGLEVRMCDLCIQSLARQRGEWALKNKSLLMKKARKVRHDEFGYVKPPKQAVNCPLT